MSTPKTINLHELDGKSIESLDLSYQNLNDNSLQYVARINCTNLNLKGNVFSKKGLAFIKDKKYNLLSLSDCHLSNDDLQNLPEATSLDLSWNQLSGYSCKFLNKKTYNKLDLSHNIICYEGCKNLIGIKCRVLDLSNNIINTYGMHFIRKLNYEMVIIEGNYINT